METVTRTIYGAHLATCKLLNRPFSVLPNSTLNQKFNVFENELPVVNEYPSLKYIAIGNKGASYEVTSNGYILTTPLPHVARHASLYNFLPFIIRRVNDDLSSTERMKYRMRTFMTIGGDNYVAYYLKVLNIDNLIPDIELRNVNNGVITVTNFTPELSDLNPVAPNLSNINLNNPNGDYLVSSAKINFVLNSNDIEEIMNACNIIYGDTRYSVINEIALCTGVDKTVQGVFGNSTAPYIESIATQIVSFIYQYHALTSNTTEVNIQLDIGSVEPLLV